MPGREDAVSGKLIWARDLALMGLALAGTMASEISVAYAQGEILCPSPPSTQHPLPSFSNSDSSSFVITGLSAGAAAFMERRSWFGEPDFNVGGSSDDWAEGYLEPQIKGQFTFPGTRSRLCGRLSAIASGTRGGLDGAGSNFDDRAPTDVTLEEAYLAVVGEDIVPLDQGSVVALSVGPQDYKVGTGFLFYDGGTDGGRRGAYWIDRRQAFEFVGRAMLSLGDVFGEVVYLDANEADPDTSTKVAGVNLELPIDFVELGASYYNIVDSDLPTRDGMSIFDVRVNAEKFDISATGEFAYQNNNGSLEAFGAYGELGYDFNLIGTDFGLSYRFAYFSGDDPDTSKSEDFDPLFYGLYESDPGGEEEEVEWGTWIQGEIIGEFVLLNSNLKTHTVRLSAYPWDDLWFNLIYYRFLLDKPEGLDPSVTSEHFADEIDFTVEWTPMDWLYLNGVIGVAIPGNGAEQFTLGDETWTHFMVYTQIDF